MKVVWFSGGISSFIAAYLTKDADEIIYIHNESQHPDTLRFLKDCENILKREIKILKSDKYKNHFEVIKAQRFLNSAYGAPCTKFLKRMVRMDWERRNPDHHIYVWGYDAEERKRADSIEKILSDYENEFPLIDNKLTKEDCHMIAKRMGLKRPAIYDMGYPNNNCIGCVKGGMGYWNKIREDFPYVFNKMARIERELGHTIIKGIYLDELSPERGRNKPIEIPSCDIRCEMIYKVVKSANSDK